MWQKERKCNSESVAYESFKLAQNHFFLLFQTTQNAFDVYLKGTQDTRLIASRSIHFDSEAHAATTQFVFWRTST